MKILFIVLTLLPMLVLAGGGKKGDRFIMDSAAKESLLMELFGALDAGKMGSDFQKALKEKDKNKLISIVAQYFRNRAPRAYCKNIKRSGNPMETADRAVRGDVTVVSYPWQFPDGKIDWHFNPTGRDVPLNHEWLWQLNRMSFWLDMCAAYEKTGDEKYAVAFNEQLFSWVATAGTYSSNWNAPGSVWRTIETGLRLMYSWQLGFETFRKSNSFSDENICLMLGSMYRQAQHLQANHKKKGNWMLMEMSGLYTFAALFPEFKDSLSMRSYAAGVFGRAIMEQILPDGMHDELSPDYHQVMLNCAMAFLQISKSEKFESEVPVELIKKLELSFEAILAMTTPGLILPRTNDTFTQYSTKKMQTALELFPERQDFRWIASSRKEGRAPGGVPTSSRFLPWSGFAVMRSDWGSEAAFCCFDAGPLGAGHWHQDKLNINIFKGGEELIYDDGGGQYEKSIHRMYGISSASHNVVLVDGFGQSRSLPNKVSEPIDVKWVSNEKFDYAVSSYDGLWGKIVLSNKDRMQPLSAPAVHTREVRFYKPEFFCVQDTMISRDGKEHTYELRFHLDTLNVERVKDIPGAFLSNYGKVYDILVIPLFPEELRFDTLSGVDTPPMGGWFVGRNDKKLHKSTTLTMTADKKKTFRFATLLIPICRATDKMPEISKRSDNTFLLRFKNKEYIINPQELSK